MRLRRGRSASKSKRSSFDGYLHDRDGRWVIRALSPLCLIALIVCLVAIPFFPVLVYFLHLPIGLWLGLLGGYWVTPDADHMGTTHEEYRAMRKLGFLGSLLVAWMIPYAYTFSHRSRKSHSIWPGTPIRFLWATLPLFLISAAVAIWLGPAYVIWYPIMLIGWSIQDIFHYKRDGLGYLGLKKRRIPRRA
jgi:uncharacterized metal-binding protein